MKLSAKKWVKTSASSYPILSQNVLKTPKVRSNSKETNIEYRIIRRTEVLFMTGLATPTLFAKMRACEFPSPIKLGRRAVGWKSTNIEAWIQKCMEAENE